MNASAGRGLPELAVAGAVPGAGRRLWATAVRAGTVAVVSRR
jgi:hypothetical protein